MSRQQVDLLERLASQVMALIELRAEKGTLQSLATTDSLTGLSNRRHFDEVLENEASMRLSSDTPLSLISLDLDHFKSINDTWGHHVGDEVLTAVAGLLRSQVRTSDIVARIGGEEFCILMSGGSENAAFALAERLRRSICELHLGPGGSVRVTGSFGVTSWRRDVDVSVAELTERADQAAYAAKRGGRNQVVLC